MNSNIVLMVLGLLAVYGLIIFGLVVLLKKLKISPKKRILFGVLIFGVITGILIVLKWPYDMIMFLNILTVFLGDLVYNLSIKYLGNPNSAQAHYTIPWLLRIPQVYFLVSIVFWGLIGWVVQFFYNRRIFNKH